ncbi:DnaJ homolog subfamily C member 7 [Seminavis robusta]|uniref:DnaJ homolog subfamily C member 7 n=1 Tax=Seminavis robusta TaxID=568900 RepID=A0A9N8ET89_9STRA|nr:DnaJ homolog subfamily C member 7 [Seminavis robusta]|eukprot:Sro1882_g303370.1 DnaJ homolog subfamily C member 7 (651) ;mRNA; f:12341-14293
MGLTLCNVASDERHYGDFICVICQQVVDLDALVTTPCSHCFCNQCLTEWVDRTSNNVVDDRLPYPYGSSSAAPRCPTCSHDILYSHNVQASKYAAMMIGKNTVTVQPLQTCQPLAYRVLKKIKVNCPLGSRVGCQWSGDYGDLKDHLLSKTAHDDCEIPVGSLPTTSPAKESASKQSSTSAIIEQERLFSLAISFKDEGNDQFSAGHIEEARELYSRALTMLSKTTDDKLKATCYSNRAAALLTLERYSECVQDCTKAIQLNPSYLKAYVRKAKALKQQGNLHQVAEVWAQAAEKCPDESAQKLIRTERPKAVYLNQLMKDGKQLLGQGSFAGAKAAYGRVLLETSAPDALVGAAKADLGLGLTESAMRFSHQIIRGLPDHIAEGYEIRGECLFLMGDFEGGQKLLSEALRQAPDLKSTQILRKRCNKVVALVKEARDLAFHRKFEQAVETYTDAIKEFLILPPKSTLFGMLYTERAESYLRLKQYDTALKEALVVLRVREDYKPAWLVRLQALHGLGRHADAKSDADNLVQRWGDDTEIRQAQTKADFKVRKQHRLDLYSFLGVSPVASELEIKQAYNRESSECHPNKYGDDSEASEDEKKAAAKRYRLLGDALEILCDDFKRQLYDAGYDQQAIQERTEKARRAAKSL